MTHSAWQAASDLRVCNPPLCVSMCVKRHSYNLKEDIIPARSVLFVTNTVGKAATEAFFVASVCGPLF